MVDIGQVWVLRWSLRKSSELTSKAITDTLQIGVYAALGFVQALLMFIFSIMLTVFGTHASKVMLHRAIVRSTLR